MTGYSVNLGLAIGYLIVEVTGWPVRHTAESGVVLAFSVIGASLAGMWFLRRNLNRIHTAAVELRDMWRQR